MRRNFVSSRTWQKVENLEFCLLGTTDLSALLVELCSRKGGLPEYSLRWTCSFKFVADVHFRDVITQGKRACSRLIYFYLRRERERFFSLTLCKYAYISMRCRWFIFSLISSVKYVIVVLILRNRIRITGLNCKKATEYPLHIYVCIHIACL